MCKDMQIRGTEEGIFRKQKTNVYRCICDLVKGRFHWFQPLAIDKSFLAIV